jgi:5,10-methylenetetrahydromethanopterin reductase
MFNQPGLSGDVSESIEAPYYRLSIALQTDKSLTAYGQLAAMIEAYGFDGVTVYNDLLYQPPWLPLLEIARVTKRIQIGVAAVVPFLCHPLNIAGNIALIDEASNGRAYLGMARGGWLDFVGVEPRKPVAALREAFTCVRHLLRRSITPLPGEFFPLAGGDSLRWPVLRPDLPFLLGSWGVKTIHACIEWIQEVKIGGSANPDLLPYYRQVIQVAQSAAGSASNIKKIGLVIGAVTAVDKDGAAARACARRAVALYLPVVADLDPTLQVDPELMRRLRAAAAVYDYASAAALISDELLLRFALAGDPVSVTEQTLRLFAAGAQRVEFGTPHGLSGQEGLRLLGEQVLPAVRRELL